MFSRKTIFLLFFFSYCTLMTAQSSLWQDVDVNAQTQRFGSTDKAFIPNHARAVTLSTDAMKAILWQAPTVNQRDTEGAMIEIPKQYGGFETYEVYQNTNIFAENIRSEYERTIRAFTGHKAGEEQTQIHLTLGHGMFNAAIYRPDSKIDYVEYASDIKNNTFFVYRRGDETLEKVKCGYIAIEKEIEASQRSNGRQTKNLSG